MCCDSQPGLQRMIDCRPGHRTPVCSRDLLLPRPNSSHGRFERRRNRINAVFILVVSFVADWVSPCCRTGRTLERQYCQKSSIGTEWERERLLKDYTKPNWARYTVDANCRRGRSGHESNISVCFPATSLACLCSATPTADRRKTRN
jgi:hypothetical protein